MTNTTRIHRGSCHCGAVRFEAELDFAASPPSRCNCTICTKLMWTGSMTKPDRFRLLTPESDLGSYVWGGRVSTRFFCKHCGTPTFGRGELAQLGGAFVSINLNTLDDLDVNALVLRHWDGRTNNWMAGARPTPWPIAIRDTTATTSRAHAAP
jgi:hypothetical protein